MTSLLPSTGLVETGQKRGVCSHTTKKAQTGGNARGEKEWAMNDSNQSVQRGSRETVFQRGLGTAISKGDSE